MSKHLCILAIFAMLFAGSAVAQTSTDPDDTSSQGPVFPKQTFGNYVTCRAQPLQYFRPLNQCGINIFETTKENTVPFDKFRISWSAGFTQNFQSLKHSHATEPDIELARIGWGFPRASANLYLHAQMAPGIRMQLTMYLSTRHHEDTWVKSGYVQMDQAPLDLGPLNALWERFITVKVGHMEINYGDAHFRRSDGGNGMYDPFVGNYILDAFTTEIGMEGYIHAGNGMVMGAITGGEINGDVQNTQQKNPAYIWKVAYDRQVNPDLRVRMSFSNYIDNKSPANTLYGGDRAGSPYWGVLESEPFDPSSQAFSGRINPGFRNKVRAYQFNPFVKYKGLELFGVIEHALGLTYPETENRTVNQYAVDAVYRFGADKFYAGVRYNYFDGQLRGIADRVHVNRTVVDLGWFPLPYMLAKAEFIDQNHNDYPEDSIFYKGNFHGVMLSAVLGF